MSNDVCKPIDLSMLIGGKTMENVMNIFIFKRLLRTVVKHWFILYF